MQSQREVARKLGLFTLLVLSFAAQISAAPIIFFDEAYHFRSNIGPNSVGLPPGDQQYVVVLNVAPTAGTAVTATQGAVTRPLPFTPLTTFPTQFRALEPFDPSLTGPWSITATNGPDVAGPLLTPPIANPQLLPFAYNLQVVGTGPTPTVTWSLPDLTGIDVESLRFRVWNDANNDIILNTQSLPLTTNAFTIPGGLLVPGVPYVFSVILQDTEQGSSENVSTAFTQSAYFTEPDLLVSSYNTNSVKRYDGATGAYLGDFVTAGGQANPRGMSLGPDGNLYVGSADPNVKRFDGTTGEFIDVFASGDPVLDMTFGPDGDLYASGFGSLRAVLVYDGTTGDLVGSIGAGSFPNGPAGLAFGADGNLYVSNGGTNQILRFNGTTGAFIDVFATIPIVCPGECPIDVNFGPDGNLYAGTNFAFGVPSDIWRFDGTTGASLGPFIPPGDPHPEVGSLFAFGPDGNLYFTSFATHEVLRYDGTTGDYIDSFAVGGGLDGPWGLAFVPEPGALTQLGAGLALLVALALRRYHGERSRRRVL